MEDFPEIERAVSTTWNSSNALFIGDKSVTADGFYAHDGFFHVFDWVVIQGNLDQLLSEPNNIVISDQLAKRLFGEEDPIGQAVELGGTESYQVSGVFSGLPKASTIQFEYVIPFSKFFSDNEWSQNWYNTAFSTYILFKEGTDVAAFNEKVHDYIREKTEGNANHRSLLCHFIW